MARFRCNSCLAVYEDYYSPDDCCLKCKDGFIRIIRNENLSTKDVDNKPMLVDKSIKYLVS
jgi:hypothetical protein